MRTSLRHRVFLRLGFDFECTFYGPGVGVEGLGLGEVGRSSSTVLVAFRVHR